mgnify:CR=1 FL=1
MSQRGNILFLILLAVVLFAALSYAVTSSTRGGGKDASKESLQSTVALLHNNMMAARSTLLRMTTIGGYQPWQIDFSKAGYSSSSPNATCTVAACKLHDPAGGGFTGYTIPAKYWQDDSICTSASTWAGRYFFYSLTVKGIGIDNQSDVVMLHGSVNDALCMAVNDASGITNPSGVPPTDAAFGNAYSGGLSQEYTLTNALQLGDAAADVGGKQMICTKQANNCNYVFYVLMER